MTDHTTERAEAVERVRRAVVAAALSRLNIILEALAENREHMDRIDVEIAAFDAWTDFEATSAEVSRRLLADTLSRAAVFLPDITTLNLAGVAFGLIPANFEIGDGRIVRWEPDGEVLILTYPKDESHERDVRMIRRATVLDTSP